MVIPTNADGSATLGFALVQMENMAAAAAARAALNNFALDARHTLSALAFSEVASAAQLPDKFEPPFAKEYDPAHDRYDWLYDERQRDCFALRYVDNDAVQQTELFAVDTSGELEMLADHADLVEQGRSWCLNHIKWSPRGTYLTTFHEQGVLIWAGDGMREVGRFKHSFEPDFLAQADALWSPCERYMAVWSGHAGNSKPERALVVYDVASGVELRAYKQVNLESDSCPYSWSPDGAYLARLGVEAHTKQTMLQVYETPSMKLTLKKLAPGVQNAVFCPKRHNVLAYLSPDTANAPATVTLLDVTTGTVVRTKQLFNVEDIQMTWHPDGTYLSVHAGVLTKAQARKKKKDLAAAEKSDELILARHVAKTNSTSVEIFRMSERGVPVEQLVIEEPVQCLTWEPTGHRFAVLHGNGPLRFSLSVYTTRSKGTAGAQWAIEKLLQVDSLQADWMSFSPAGGVLLLMGRDKAGGTLEWYDVDSQTTFARAEHMQATHAEWDPSGRLVSTMKTQPFDNPELRHTVENGVKLWTLHGRNVFSEGVNCLFQMLWRPRPQLLDDDEARKVRFNLGKFVAKYEAADKVRAAIKRLVQGAARLRERREWYADMADRLMQVEDWDQRRAAEGLFYLGAGDAVETVDVVNVEEVTVEEFAA